MIDNDLLNLIISSYKGEYLMASNKVFAIELNKLGVACDEYVVNDAIKRLVNNGDIVRTWNGRFFLTRPLNHDTVISYREKKIEQAPPLSYQVYNYFKENGVGLVNAINMVNLAEWFRVSDREIRQVIYNINFRVYSLKNGGTFKRKIYGDTNGYYMVSNDRERKKMRNARVLKLLNAVKELNILDEDFALDNQYKIPLSEFETDIIKSISDDI